MSNVTRVLLSEAVTDFIAYEATVDQAFAVLNLAVDVAEQEQRGGEPWLS